MYCFQKAIVAYSFAFCSSSSEKQAVKSENMASEVILSSGPQKIEQKASGHAWTRSNTPKVLRPSRNLQNTNQKSKKQQQQLIITENQQYILCCFSSYCIVSMPTSL